MTDLNVLYEDNHLLAVEKLPCILTMGDSTGDRTMVDFAADYLREKYNKPGNVFVGVVHRLDRPVSGVLLFARTSKAASRLADQFRRGTVKKTYHAVVSGNVVRDENELTDWLSKARNSNIVSVVNEAHPNGKKSVLKYKVVSRSEGRTQLQINPLTGRSHQIRVQLSSRGTPICGDVKYGSKIHLNGRISLHASSLEIEHPTRREPLLITSEAPANL